VKGDHKVNWKLLADRTGMPIGKLRAATKGLSGRPRKLLLDTLAMPTSGEDSKRYTRQAFAEDFERDMLDNDHHESMWDALYYNWQQNVSQHGRWRREATQLVELQKEIHSHTYIEETTNER